jgi:hypothetical protein
MYWYNGDIPSQLVHAIYLPSNSTYLSTFELQIPFVLNSRTFEIYCKSNIMLQLNITVKSAEYRTQTVPTARLPTSDHIPPHSHCQ